MNLKQTLKRTIFGSALGLMIAGGLGLGYRAVSELRCEDGRWIDNTYGFGHCEIIQRVYGKLNTGQDVKYLVQNDADSIFTAKCGYLSIPGLFNFPTTDNYCEVLFEVPTAEKGVYSSITRIHDCYCDRKLDQKAERISVNDHKLNLEDIKAIGKERFEILLEEAYQQVYLPSQRPEVLAQKKAEEEMRKVQEESQARSNHQKYLNYIRRTLNEDVK